jgi:hypothetical protein
MVSSKASQVKYNTRLALSLSLLPFSFLITCVRPRPFLFSCLIYIPSPDTLHDHILYATVLFTNNNDNEDNGNDNDNEKNNKDRNYYYHYYSAAGILSTSSLSARQLSACSSAYFTRSCAHSWCRRLMWYCDFWKKSNSSRMHSRIKTPRACC